MSTLPASVSHQGLGSFAEERTRPLGSKFAPQRQIYLFYLPCILLFVGFIVWLLPGNATFVLGSAAGGLVAVYVLLDTVFRDTPLRLTTIYGMTLLVGYNLGSLNSWLTLPRGGLSLADFFARDPAALARAIAACMAAAALLFALGELYERPIFGREFRLSFAKNPLPVIVASTALLVAGYATGQLGFMGITVENGHVNPAVSLIMWWSVPAFAYSVCATLNIGGSARLLAGACTLVQLVALVPFGRRVFGFAVLLAAIGTRLGRYRSRMSIPKKALIGALGAAIVVTASVTFLYLRIAGYQDKARSNSLGVRIAIAADLIEKYGPFEVLQRLGTDTNTRFIIGFFSDLLEASQHSAPLLGRDVLFNLQQMVPSIISADKFGLEEFGGEEEMANMQWGFSYKDEGNSLLTAGAADFGPIGALLYPLLMILLLRKILEWLQASIPTFPAVIVALAFIDQFLQPEDAPVGYFVQVRNALLMALLFYLVSLLPKFRLRPE